jgi:DNA-binding XRE family transcriptional regulator
MTTLREARLKARLTALGLGKLADVPEMRVFHIERGRYRPRLDEAQRLARVLGQPVEELFPGLEGGKR